MGRGLYALNFFSHAFIDQLKRGRKTATIRLGDKSSKYERGQVVWITVGHQHSPREKIFSAVIDDVEVKRAREVIRPPNDLPPAKRDMSGHCCAAARHASRSCRSSNIWHPVRALVSASTAIANACVRRLTVACA